MAKRLYQLMVSNPLDAYGAQKLCVLASSEAKAIAQLAPEGGKVERSRGSKASARTFTISDAKGNFNIVRIAKSTAGCDCVIGSKK